MQLSYWEKITWFSNIDVLIIGGGITGLNAALTLKEKDPHLKVTVVDRGLLPYGASTRNAGFACFGSISELLDDLSHMSEDAVFSLVEKRWKGLLKLRSILKDPHIGYEGLGGYEMFTPGDAELYKTCEGKLEYFNKQLKEITGISSIYTTADQEISRFGFHKVEHLLFNKGEGQIDTGKMMDALLHKVQQHKVHVITGLEVIKLHEGTDKVTIETGSDFSFDVKKVLITTDGFAKQLLPELDVVPGRAQVLITEPIKDLKIKGTFHYDKGYYYFRNVGNRLLFGGGRNLDFKGEETYAFGVTDNIQQQLESILKEVILPGTEYKIAERWSGVLGLGKVKSTIIQKTGDNIYCCVRTGGMGVALGSLIGEEAAALLMNN